MSTLQRAKDQGGWAIEIIAIKCKTLLYYGVWLVKTKRRSYNNTDEEMEA
jgi:hypothetical protein